MGGIYRTEQSAGIDGGGPVDPLSAVRFGIPRRPRRYVDRPRLNKRLDDGAERPLTLVSAPAGSGKTALVAAWAAARHAATGHGMAWLTLEEQDAPAAMFWADVVEALRRQGVVLAGARDDSADAHSQLLTELATALARRTRPVTLVLDGYEVAAAERSSDLDFLLQHSDQRLRVVILTRVDPALPLLRYRQAGIITEVRMADLAFTEEETARLMQLSAISLCGDSVAALTSRTRGWAVGLRFASMYLERGDDPDEAVAHLAGDSGNIAQYLTVEMLRTQSVDVRSLLLRTSVVDVLQPGLIEELAGPSAGETLRSLAAGNVLVEPLPEHPGWYRYHPFLRDLLRAELAYESPRQRRQLLKTAADWFARQGLLEAAVGLASEAGAWSDASAYVVDGLAIGEVLLGDDSSGVYVTLRKMPPDVADPAATVVRAALALTDHDTAWCAHELEQACRSPAPESDHDHAVELAADIVRATSSALTGDPRTALLADLAEQKLGTLDQQKVAAHPELALLVRAVKARSLLQDGDIAGARAALIAAVDAEAPGYESLTAACLGYLALLDSSEGALRCAHEWAARSVALTECAGVLADGPLAAVEIALAGVSIERHELRAGDDHVRAAMRSFDACDEPVLRAQAAVVQARLLEARGALDEAMALVEEAAGSPGIDTGWPVRPLQVEAAKLMVAQGWPDEAARMIERLDDSGDAVSTLVLGHAHLQRQDWTGVAASASSILAQGNDMPLQATVGARLLEAAYELHRGSPGRARTAVADAVRLARPEELRRPFWEAAPAVRHLLESDPELVGQNTWLRPVLGPRTRTVRIRTGSPPGRADTEPIIEPLTPKEIEVLGHLSELLTTEEIALEMYVSVNTVRTHIRNILRKLAVSRRNEAVRRARALSLIPA
ncbi:LuxR C-terminal-related transcriptional regulator [Kribbella sp. NPDC003557]|uniref:LuxR C-terminal-related transcriptional regulator n=1 Tax=Kribbella sp. NPDC003557 TaxID=3154449 RepID=UPI0033B07F43